jgi:hypothetical protein
VVHNALVTVITGARTSFPFSITCPGVGRVLPQLGFWYKRDFQLRVSHRVAEGLLVQKSHLNQKEAWYLGFGAKPVETNAASTPRSDTNPRRLPASLPLCFTAPESREAVREARSSGLEEPYEVVSLTKDG